MTILKCSAANCVYNDAHQCSRGEINVMGESARIADETCCGSFQENLMQQQMVWNATVAAKRSRLNVKPTTVHTMTIANVQQQPLM